MDYLNEKENLVIFLKNLTKTIEEGEIHDKQFKSIIEFKSMYNLLNEKIRYNVDSIDSINDIKEEEVKEFMKFLLLGWFMYNLVKKN